MPMLLRSLSLVLVNLKPMHILELSHYALRYLRIFTMFQRFRFKGQVLIVSCDKSGAWKASSGKSNDAARNEHPRIIKTHYEYITAMDVFW